MRAHFEFGPNQIPVDDYYDVEVKKDVSGAWTLSALNKILERSLDPYALQCKP